MDVLDYYKRGWAEVQDHLVAWVVFYTVFVGVAIMTCGIGGLLMPNAMREIRDTHREQRAPEVSRLFNMERAADDIVNWLIYFGAMSLGGAAGGVGGTIAAVLLQFQMPLAAEDKYQPLDNARLSFKHVTQHPSDHIVFMLVATGLGMASALLCLLPLVIVGPIIGKAHWLWYEDAREEIEGYAAEMGVKLLEG